ncbi:MAG: hypothetical protein GX623_06725 [Clostridiales bacterium]|nr:hypothetical protein [Clostridiales bacterium]
MKILLIIIGLVLIVAGVYGFIAQTDGGVKSQGEEAITDAVEATGVQSAPSGSSFNKFIIDNRLILLIVGAVALLAGILIKPRPAA